MSQIYSTGEFISFLEKVFGSSGQISGVGTKNKNISFVCPICKKDKGSQYSNKKLAIKLECENALTKCWVCGYKSRNLFFLIRKYSRHNLQEYIDKFIGKDLLLDRNNQQENPDEKTLSLPNDFTFIASCLNQSSSQIERYIKYLEKRFGSDFGIDKLWYWKFGFSEQEIEYQNRIIIPSFDKNGNLNYFTGRALSNYHKPKYLNPPIEREDIIFNEINICWDEELLLVEGPLDLIKCSQNAVSLLGSDLTTDFKLFENIVKNKTKIVVALDPDAERKAIKIASLLYEYDIEVRMLKIPKKYNDIGEMDQKEVKEILYNAIPFSKDYMLRAKIAEII